MLTTKKISPVEFRLNNKAFYVDYSPTNYFERFRFEIIFSSLVRGFFSYYGLYFYLHKLKIIDDKLVFMLYYYYTRRFMRTRSYFSKRLPTEGFINFLTPTFNKKFKSLQYIHFYNPTILSIRLRPGLRRLKKIFKIYPKHIKTLIVVKRWNPTRKKFFLLNKAETEVRLFNTQMRSTVKSFWTYRRLISKRCGMRIKRRRWRNRRGRRYIKLWNKKRKPFWWQWPKIWRFSHRTLEAAKKKGRKKSRQQIFSLKKLNLLSCNLFFSRFFLHFFKHSSLILAKSLYKNLFSNLVIREEHFILLSKTYYIMRYNWSRDFFFFIHYGLIFRNSTFMLPILIKYIAPKWRHWQQVNLFLNILRRVYYYKSEIRGIRILLTGVYDRHGRTRSWLFILGNIKYMEQSIELYFDSIPLPTIYGMTILKIWVQYFQVADGHQFWKMQRLHKIKSIIKLQTKEKVLLETFK